VQRDFAALRGSSHRCELHGECTGPVVLVEIDPLVDGVRLVLAQAEVPAGRYAREAVCAMGRDATTYGEDFADRVAANVVSEEEDVRDVLTKVELGEADAGIVYVSDATLAPDRVGVVAIPDQVNVVATYPIAPVAGGNSRLANAFIAYLLGPEGQATLKRFGFEAVR